MRCTLGLNIKSKGGFAVCIHADMTPLRASLSDDQLAHTVTILERILNYAATIHPQLFGGEEENSVKTGSDQHPTKPEVASETDYAVKMRGLSTMSSQSHEQSSQRKQSSTGSAETEADPLKLGSDAKIEGHLSV